MRQKRKTQSVIWEKDNEIGIRIKYLVKVADVDWVDITKVHTFRSWNSNSRAIARIWGLPRIWHLALGIEPGYVLEVITEKYDKLNQRQKDEVLLHELAHIPHNFSGALMPHTRKGTGNFHSKLEDMIKRYKQNRDKL